MGVISGASGKIDGVNDIAEWSIETTAQIAEPVASGAPGVPIIVVGNTDWRGTFRQYGQLPTVMPGDSISSFVGHTGSKSYTGSVIVTKVALTCDIAGGGVLAWQVDFEADSALATGTTSATDSGGPKRYTAAGCKVQWAGSDVPNVQRYTLEFSMPLRPYSPTSATYKRRVASGIKMAAFSIDQDEADATVRLVEGDIQIAKFFVTATNYWQLSYAAIETAQQQVPIEQGDIVTYRTTGKWSGYKLITGSWTQGTILKAGAPGSAWYP